MEIRVHILTYLEQKESIEDYESKRNKLLTPEVKKMIRDFHDKLVEIAEAES